MRWLSKISEPWQLRLFNQPSAPDSLATTTASRHPLQDACQLQANVHQRPELAPGPQGLPGLHLRDPDLVRERLGRPEHRHLWGCHCLSRKPLGRDAAASAVIHLLDYRHEHETRNKHLLGRMASCP